MNTFSKTLAPSIRISYMILPEKLMACYVEKANFYSNSASSCEQYALARFIEEGYFERHLSRMKKYYQAKGEDTKGCQETGEYICGVVIHKGVILQPAKDTARMQLLKYIYVFP